LWNFPIGKQNIFGIGKHRRQNQKRLLEDLKEMRTKTAGAVVEHY
jgi:hypothetical protein